MAKFYPSDGNGGGAGVSSDDVTITSYDVPESKTALTSDSNDSVVKGKLKEYDSEVEAVGTIDSENKRVKLTIPSRGLYSASSKLFASFTSFANLIGLVADKLAIGQSILGITGTYKGLGNAKEADVRSGVKFSTKDLSNATGTMPEQEGSTVVPGTSNKTAVSANRYVTGDIIVKGDPNLIAANIKKNVTIFGIKGTWDGWVPETHHFYNKGENPSGCTVEGAASFNNEGYIYTKAQFTDNAIIRLPTNFDFSKFKTLRLTFFVVDHPTTSNGLRADLVRNEGINHEQIAYGEVDVSENSNGTLNIPIANVTGTGPYYIRIYNRNGSLSSTTSELKIYTVSAVYP